jgi:N6-L-threonylcarbamoyladenine synthase
MRILSIESSCDESALAITEQNMDGGKFAPITVLANNVLSQIDIHREYGGVFPAVAKREHAKALTPLLIKTLSDAGLHLTQASPIDPVLVAEITLLLEREPELLEHMLAIMPTIARPDIDAIALTTGPGLEPALWVGINFAKALALLWNIPVLPVNHMEGHLLAAIVSGHTEEDGKHALILDEVNYPALGLLVSGGHSELILMEAPGSYKLLGETRDDAVGEAFDKVARLLGLPYPGGPEISKLANLGTPGVYKLPRPMINSGDYDFSFAGIKTAVRYLLQDMPEVTDEIRNNVARDFEDSCIEVLTKKSVSAAKEFAAQTAVIGGGVSANQKLRTILSEKLGEIGIPLLLPDRGLSTDNALMIALAAHLHPRNPAALNDIKARGHWRIHEA